MLEFIQLYRFLAGKHKGHDVHSILVVAIDTDGNRLPVIEKQVEDLFHLIPARYSGNGLEMLPKLETIMERELKYRGIIKDGQPYYATLIGRVELV